MVPLVQWDNGSLGTLGQWFTGTLGQQFTGTHGSLGQMVHLVHWKWDTGTDGSFGSLGQWFTGTHGSFGSLGQ